MDKKAHPEKYAEQNAILQPGFELPTMQKDGGTNANAGLAGLGLTAGAAGGGLDALGLTGSGSTAGPAGNNLAALLGNGESKKPDKSAANTSAQGASKEIKDKSASKYVVNNEDGDQGAADPEETDALIGITGDEKRAEKEAILATMPSQNAKKVDEVIDKCLDTCVQKCPEKCCRPMNFPWGYEGQPLKL